MTSLSNSPSREQMRLERYLIIAEVSRRLNQRRVAEKLANLSYLAMDNTDWEPPRFSFDQLD